MPRCPSWLDDDDAKEAWELLAPQLKDMGILTDVDGFVLTRYCRLWSRWKRAEMAIPRQGDRAKKSTVSLALARELLRLVQELGLAPSARTRIRVEVNEPYDALEAILSSNEHELPSPIRAKP